MKIKIHKGAQQIGGSIVEISTNSARIIIDFGADLPSNENMNNNIEIEGVTVGKRNCDAILLSHYHGDHIGLVYKVLPDIPVYIGCTAKKIQKALVERISRENISTVNRFNTFKTLDKLIFKDICVTPFFIDHSAFDAYMLLIEVENFNILYTGDFRTHGFRGSKTIPMLKSYIGTVDYLITEGTLLTRDNDKIMSENELQQGARKIMKKYKYVFVLSSSTNIDRIGAFYHANPKGRLFICDSYQKKILSIVKDNHRDNSKFYDFKYVYSYGPNLNKKMNKNGFCMLIRQGKYFKQFLERYKDNSIIIYSMWSGYLDNENAKNEELIKFLEPYSYTKLHTSGHATKQDLKEVIETVKPRKGIIPIHTENQDGFDYICGNFNVIKLEDNEFIEFK